MRNIKNVEGNRDQVLCEIDYNQKAGLAIEDHSEISKNSMIRQGSRKYNVSHILLFQLLHHNMSSSSTTGAFGRFLRNLSMNLLISSLIGLQPECSNALLKKRPLNVRTRDNAT